MRQPQTNNHSTLLRHEPADRTASDAYRITPGYGTLRTSRRMERATCMKRVLIIEDDKDIVEMSDYNWEKECCEVAGVFDGSSVLNSMKKPPPFFLLLDLMLPK